MYIFVISSRYLQGPAPAGQGRYWGGGVYLQWAPRSLLHESDSLKWEFGHSLMCTPYLRPNKVSDYGESRSIISTVCDNSRCLAATY